ncbi:MAG: hypothetical protein U1C74_19840, partial [Phenylobacterium sp.]|nr:hypothetical protein [Phenylobacterium sp.]
MGHRFTNPGTPMTSPRFLLGLLAAGLLTSSAAASETADLTVTFKGMAAHKGAVLFVLTDSEAAYD